MTEVVGSVSDYTIMIRSLNVRRETDRQGRKRTRLKKVENDASAKPPNSSSASCDLDL